MGNVPLATARRGDNTARGDDVAVARGALILAALADATENDSCLLFVGIVLAVVVAVAAGTLVFAAFNCMEASRRIVALADNFLFLPPRLATPAM